MRTTWTGAMAAVAALIAAGCAGEAVEASAVVADVQVHDGIQAPGTLDVQPGTNPTGKTGAGKFSPLGPSDEVRIQWGFQGFYMAVFAVRCDQAGPEPIWVVVQLSEDGVVLASARLRRPALEPGGDGMFYAWDLFVLTPDWEEWVDREVQLEASLLDDTDRELGAAVVTIVVRAPSLFD